MTTAPIHQTLISGITVEEISDCHIGHVIGSEVTSSSQTIISDCHIKSLKGVQIGHQFTSSPIPLTEQYIHVGGVNTWVSRNPKPGSVSRLPICGPPLPAGVSRLSVKERPIPAGVSRLSVKERPIPTSGSSRYVKTTIIHPPVPKTKKQRKRVLWKKTKEPSIEITITEESPSLGPEFEKEEE